MNQYISSRLNKVLIFTLISLIGIFSFSLLKNIQYPLMWEDEADTAMFGQRILRWGYPKVHDGKNIVSPFNSKNNAQAIDKKYDAYIYSGWVPFYFSVIGVRLAETTSDIYIKTALLRLPFAILGLIGLVIIAASVIPVFGKNRRAKLSFLLLFTLFELLSISIVLHLREVRYFSLAIFLSACVFYVYFRYHLFHTIDSLSYSFFTIFLLLLLFNTYHPVYFIFLLTITLDGLNQIYNQLKQIRPTKTQDAIAVMRQKLLVFLQPIAVPLISFILIIPFIIFFETFKLSSETAKELHFTSTIYINNIIGIFNFFKKFEFLNLALLIKSLLLLMLISGVHPIDKKKLAISSFLSVYYIIHILLISQSPLMFTRYFIVLLPVLVIIILLDLFTIMEILPTASLFPKIHKKKLLFSVILSLLFVLDLVNSNKIKVIQGHIYELFHQYKGPIDYTIPYIMENFRNPQNLVIATNYEETAYMYYLGSKVTVGFVGNNLAEDMKFTPDIVSYRKIPWWGKSKIFLDLMEKDKYEMVKFPVADYLVNNIPELYFIVPHLYKTQLAKNDKERVVIFVREDLLPPK